MNDEHRYTKFCNNCSISADGNISPGEAERKKETMI